MDKQEEEQINQNFSKLMKKHSGISKNTNTLDDETVIEIGKKFIIKYHDALKRLGEMNDE